MRRIAALLTAPLIVLSLTGLVFAQSSTPPQASDAPPTSSPPPAAVTSPQPVMPSPTRPAGKAAGLRHMGGEAVSVSSDSRTMTVKHIGRKKTKQLTFTLAGDAAARVADFKPGDSVRVGYVGDMGALVAQSVTHKRRAAKR